MQTLLTPIYLDSRICVYPTTVQLGPLVCLSLETKSKSLLHILQKHSSIRSAALIMV
jgi:hypothetical protein